jgi:hypothetical protein
MLPLACRGVGGALTNEPLICTRKTSMISEAKLQMDPKKGGAQYIQPHKTSRQGGQLQGARLEFFGREMSGSSGVYQKP